MACGLSPTRCQTANHSERQYQSSESLPLRTSTTSTLPRFGMNDWRSWGILSTILCVWMSEFQLSLMLHEEVDMVCFSINVFNSVSVTSFHIPSLESHTTNCKPTTEPSSNQSSIQIIPIPFLDLDASSFLFVYTTLASFYSMEFTSSLQIWLVCF